MSRERVAVALSGGVDSSVAACVLQEAGYEVIGVTMRLWSEEEATPSDQRHPHSSARGIHDAEELCSSLGIPFHLIGLEDEFKHYVIDYFCQEYARGRTPNPCVACNQHIKFGSLLDQALSLGADYLATGHYARIQHSDGTYHLLKGVDPDKDQSYMLYTLGQGKLEHLLFPLGDYLKAQVRELAREKGLPTAGKPSSQDICFISGDYGAFLRRYSTTTSGEIVSQQGEVLGEHKGTAFHTVGQRHGLGIAAAERLYVTKIEPGANRLTVGTEEELYSSGFVASKVNWVSGQPPSEPIRVAVKIRYRSPQVAATLRPKPDSAEIEFHQPQRAVTPGQAVVFYQHSEVLGGGTIANQE
ncbi:MAG: tRNA 2-thiouridine(34) synthase MnmA [Ardenticatenia bacterium]|nr:tRNA 2-thiouridine(34) synthase MnmA [Ardenticatenia bacterium]